LAISTKRREQTTRRSCAVRQAESTASAPAVWLSIAGTQPIAWSARNVTAAAIEFGSINPTASPGLAPRASRRPSTRLAAMTRLYPSGSASGSAMIA
jgi:hypothetical protein